MRRTDRLLGIMLHLRAGKVVTAAELARRFEVSARTIYRDMDALSALGVPVYAEQGRTGGFRLLEGYFLPAIAFTQGEAVSLALGLAILDRLRARPFVAGLEAARAKLLAAMPAHLSAALAAADTFIGFERQPEDAFHVERAEPPLPEQATAAEYGAIDVFLQAILDGAAVALEYRSPYRDSAAATRVEATPRGLFWDRDRWYLVGDRLAPSPGRRVWRADRVVDIRALPRRAALHEPFDVRELLGRRWLSDAMRQWTDQAPVRIRLAPAQAARLRADWYYRHAHYVETVDGVMITFGQDQRDIVVELLRWLGPGAELLEPREWRSALRDDLLAMLAVYDEPHPPAPSP
jgi:predicted DNA-binding transcriptional regulator YafY